MMMPVRKLIAVCHESHPRGGGLGGMVSMLLWPKDKFDRFLEFGYVASIIDYK